MSFNPNLLWLIQKNQSDRVAVLGVEDNLDSLGVRWTEVEIDLQSLHLPQIDGLTDSDIVICHGPGFVRRYSNTSSQLQRGCFFNPETFRWSQFQQHWRDEMLSIDARLSTVDELRVNPPEFPVFIRPDADSKAFEGGVWSSSEWETLAARLSPDLEVMVASPVRVDAEYRVFVVNSQVVAASEYRSAGQPSINGFVPDGVIDLAFKADSVWHPADAYVMDIARSGTRYGIVETNCIMASRYYGADPKAILVALCEMRGGEYQNSELPILGVK